MRLVVAILLSVVLLPGPSAAQQITTGTIQGTVTDATGASMPGVNVEARHVGTHERSGIGFPSRPFQNLRRNEMPHEVKQDPTLGFSVAS